MYIVRMGCYGSVMYRGLSGSSMMSTWKFPSPACAITCEGLRGWCVSQGCVMRGVVSDMERGATKSIERVIWRGCRCRCSLPVQGEKTRLSLFE